MTDSRSPAEKVFAIPELMEMILLELPIRQVLQAQRINKDCEATIKASSKLQQALFLKPFPLQSLHPPKNWSSCVVEFFDELVREAQSSKDKDVLRVNTKGHPVAVNPFSDYWIYDSFITRSRVVSWRPTVRKARSWREIARDRPEASWQRMYFTQPAVFIDGAETFGDLGYELTDVQHRLDLGRERHRSRPFLDVDYPGDLHALLLGKLDARKIKRDHTKREFEHLQAGEEMDMPGGFEAYPVIID